MQEQDLLRAVVNNIPDVIYVKDVEGVFLLANPPAQQLLGAISAAEIVGKSDFAYFPLELAGRFAAVDQEVIHSGQPLTNREELITDSNGDIALDTVIESAAVGHAGQGNRSGSHWS